MDITVIGETNIDIAVVPCQDTSHVSAKQACTPSHISFHHGGVARNIAHNLCLLGHNVQLMTVFGDDDFATRLIDDCQTIGMDLSLSSQFKDTKSPIFLSFNDEIGRIQSAHSDIELNSFLDLDWMRARIDAINRSDLVVADTLLSAEALTFLIDHCLVPLYIDTVSPNRALLLSEAIRQSWKKSFYALKCNLAEAQTMTGIIEPKEAAKCLNAKGIEKVYLTLGEDGVIFCSKKEIKHFPAVEVEAVNVTGSGDAFLAGVVHGNAIGYYGEQAILFGLEAARQTVKSEGPVAQSLAL